MDFSPFQTNKKFQVKSNEEKDTQSDLKAPFVTSHPLFSRVFQEQGARFYAGAVQLANLGALTRIILSGVLLSKF